MQWQKKRIYCKLLEYIEKVSKKIKLELYLETQLIFKQFANAEASANANVFFVNPTENQTQVN